jgi:hypothetical protein
MGASRSVQKRFVPDLSDGAHDYKQVELEPPFARKL